MESLLTLLVLVPLLGAIVGALLPGGKGARAWALLVSLGTAGIAAALAYGFFTSDSTSQFRITFSRESVSYYAVSIIGFSPNMGVDAVSMWLILLTAFLTPLAILASFGSIKVREKEYYAWMTMLLGAMLGVFVARDAILFYVFFELTLIPMFFIIGIWGGPERRYAAGKFFLFTFAGSVFTLAAIVYLGMRAGHDGNVSFSINDIIRYAQNPAHMTQTARTWVALGLLAGFAIKVPLFPVHTWLPLAHTEAPTAGSVILAGVLLKLGTYGIFRLALPIGLMSGGKVVSPGLIHFLGVLSVVAIIYGALVAWVQTDIKKLVAYSSVSHMGFVVLGLIALNDYGMQGSVLYMINHGLSTGALFLVIGMIYDRYHTRDIDQLSGLARKMPIMAFFFVLFTLSSIGLPGLNGFVSEFLTILGAFTSDYLGVGYGVLAALGIILGAIYMLHMTARIIWGPLKTPEVHGDDHGKKSDSHGHDHGHGARDDGVRDLSGREITVLVPLALAVILLGVLPNGVLKSILQPVQLARRSHSVAVETTPSSTPTAAVAIPVAAPVAQVR